MCIRWITPYSTFGDSIEQILAKITWPERANMIWLRKVVNHITHSKSDTSWRDSEYQSQKVINQSQNTIEQSQLCNIHQIQTYL